MKPEMIWNIEKGMAQSSGDLSVALRERGALYQRVATWFEDYDVLACPAAIVAPFDVDMRYVEQVGDHKHLGVPVHLGQTLDQVKLDVRERPAVRH